MKILYLFILFFLSNFLYATETLLLNGDHFFLGAITPGETKVFLLKTHSKSPSLSRFYIKYQKKENLCVESITVTRYKTVGATNQEFKEQICQRSIKKVISKQFHCELKRKREGQKTAKTYQLVITQENENLEPSFSFEELSSREFGNNQISRNNERFTFDYNQTIKIINFAKNHMNLWSPEALIEAPYLERIDIEFTCQAPEHTISQAKIEPVVKVIQLNLNNLPPNKYKPFVLNFEYYTVERAPLTVITTIRDGIEQQECVSYEFKPQKKTHHFFLNKNQEATGIDSFSLLVAQKYLNSPLKFKLEKSLGSNIQSLKLNTKRNHTDIDVKSTSLIRL